MKITPKKETWPRLKHEKAHLKCELVSKVHKGVFTRDLI